MTPTLRTRTCKSLLLSTTSVKVLFKGCQGTSHFIQYFFFFTLIVIIHYTLLWRPCYVVGQTLSVKKKNNLCATCRCRLGYFHVVNNDYTHWEMYAIGGSANPTINSQGNRFVAPDDRFSKEVIDLFIKSYVMI